MKLLRYGPKGKEKPGLVDADGRIRDISRHVKDITPAALDSATLGEAAQAEAGEAAAGEGQAAHRLPGRRRRRSSSPSA